MAPSKTLIDVKLALAEKYQHLANLTKSKTRQSKLATRAERYRRQAAQIARTQKVS